MIKHATGCNIIVGQNGWIWISGEPEKEALTEKTIKMIEGHSHLSGLTDKVKEFLEKETGQKIDLAAIQPAPEEAGPQEFQQERPPFREHRPFQDRRQSFRR